MTPYALFVAQPTYTETLDDKKIWNDLPKAAAAARTLAEKLAARGYQISHRNLLDGGECFEVAKSLNGWFRQVPDGSSVILLWTGHGVSDGGHFLICQDSPQKKFLNAYTAIDTSAIAQFIGNCQAEKILIILDTCYSGQGAGDMVESLEKILKTRTKVVGQQRAFAIIASTHYLTKAKEGVFIEALQTALFKSNLSTELRAWGDNDELIHTDDLCAATLGLMPADLAFPEYKASGVGQRFIPNPRYRENLPAEIVEERQWRLSRSDAGEHFVLAARGIEVGETGWFFSGRKRLLGELVDWLDKAENGVRVVTGPPGGGKSAVIGRLATLSDPDYRRQAIEAGTVIEGADPLPRPGVIDVAVHAKGKTLDDCGRALAKGLGIEVGSEASLDIERLVDEIGKFDRARITLAIDALDEAADGQSEAIASRLIAPLGRLPKVKVLVGTRRSLDGKVVPATEGRHGRLRHAFSTNAKINDLDDEADTQADIAGYVRRRLQSGDKHRNADPALIQKAADRVAQQAEGVFLYARIVSRTLQDQDQLDGLLPASALEAFEQDLAIRFKGDEQRVNDLLGALAWGEGKGLTRRIWPLLANALARREPPYADADIGWALDHAGWHIVEAGEDGQTVYRLAHQALADGYRSKRDETEAQGRIVAALRRDRDGKQIKGAAWLDADKYLWRHLAGHGEKAGLLDELIKDPGYLAVADPARLVIALPKVRAAEEKRYAQVYERAVDRLINLSPIDRMALIHMTAEMEDPELAPALEPPAPTSWRCSWARVKPSTPHRIVDFR